MPDPQAAIVWGNIQRLFKGRGWRQADLADKAGIPRPTVNRWKRSLPNPTYLQRVAGVLGVSVDELLREGDAQKGNGKDPVGHLSVYEGRVIEAMRRNEKLARAIRHLVKEFGADEDE